MAEQKKKIFTPDNNKPKKKPEPKQPPMEQPDGFTQANQEPEKQSAEPEAQQPAPPDPQEIIRQKQKDIKKSLKGMKKNLEIKLSGKKDDVKISKPNKEAPVSEKKNIKELDASTYHRASAKMADSDKPNKSSRALELRLKGNRKDRKDLEKSWKKGFARGKSYSQMAKQGGLSYREETEIQEMASKPHVFVGVKDTDSTSNLRPSISYKPGKSADLIIIKPVETDFFNENLKELVNSPYDFLEELGLHTNFGILIRDKGNEKRMVDAIAKKKSFSTSSYHGDKVYAVDTNENRLRKTLESSKINENIQEKAVSKQQQKFFGLVRAIQKGEASGSPEAEKAAKDMSKKDVKDFASTKHKGLPKKVQSESELNKRIKELKNKPVKEELPPHLAKHFDKKGNAIKGKWKDGKWKANKKQPDFKIKDVTPKGYGPADEACWPNFKQVGLKKKGKKMVPNCVPEETNEDVNVASSVFNKAKFVRSFKEMSADKAYKAMDKADKQSRGEMSVTDPKKAVKRRLQAKKFADYSIKKTLNKEEFNAMYEEALIENEMYDIHEKALQENMHRNLQTFGKELQAYSDKSGGIDKKYFNKIAQTALDGKMPAKSDVDGDTDPRDFVLGMMQRILGKPVMKNYKGISPAFEDNHKEVEKRVKMFKRLRDKKASQGYQKTDLANEGIIKKGWKPGTYHVKDADGKIHGTYKSGKHASKAMHKLMDKGAHKELEVSRADEAYDQDHADFYAGKDPKKKKMIVPPKDPKYKHGTGIDGQKGNTNEETYDVKTAKTKYGKITVKSFDSHDDAKSHLASMNKKGHKGIISQDGKPVKEEEVHEGDMKIPPYANRKTAQAEKKAREEAQRKRAGLDEAKKSDYELYHKDFSSAMQHAYEVAKKRGYIVDKDDIDNKVATGPRKPSSGKTNRYILGTDKKQNLHVQVANLDNKRYELNMYIEDVQQEDMDPVNKVAVKKKFKDRKDKDIDNDGDIDSSDKYLHKRRKAISKAMAKEHHEKDANGEPIPHDDAEGNDINEISDIKIMDTIHKARKIDKQANTKGIGMGPKDRTYGLKKSRQANRMHDKLMKRRDFRELERHGRFLDKGEPGYRKAGIDKGHKDRAMHMKNMKKYNEELSKNVSKLNKIQENRRLERNKVVADGQGGAGEVGTDELTKNYQQNTPGQPNELIRESSVVVNSQDMFKRFEDMVSYMMGISVTHPESFQMFPIGESGRMRLEYEHGPLATICETDVINFFGPNVDMEQFVEMVKEFGVNVTTAENSFVVGDSEGTEGTVKELSPGQYAEEYSKKYTTGGMMDQMRANIEAIAKRI